jgi:hypothetical protein
MIGPQSRIPVFATGLIAFSRQGGCVNIVLYLAPKTV